MELLLVHLTDIHIEAERDFDILLGRSEAISRAIMLHITNVENTTIFLCVTGDITYSGTICLWYLIYWGNSRYYKKKV